MRLHRKSLLILICTIAAISILSVTFAQMSSEDYFSTEPGMGISDEEAELWEQMEKEGKDIYEIFNSLYPDATNVGTNPEPQTVENENTESGMGQNSEANSSQSTPTNTDQIETAQAESGTQQTVSLKIYSHDFDTITEEARENFVYFSKDGIADSMYLNINSDSVENTLTGAELNATRINNETGVVNYVDAEGNTLFSWVVETWESEDSYTLDLTAKLDAYEAEGINNTYKLSLMDTTLPEGNSIKLKVKVPYDNDQLVKSFTLDENGNYVKGKSWIVENGYIVIPYEGEITSYILSTDDLTELNTVEVEEAASVASSEEVIEEVAEMAEEIPAEVEEPVADEAVEAEITTPNYTVPIIIGCIVVLAAVAGIVIYRKKQ